MTHYVNEGSIYAITKNFNHNIVEKLPAGTYHVMFNPKTGYYLDSIPNFEVKGKIYGDVQTRVNRIMNTYEERPNNTGVLLSGEKGSGKTLLAKMTCVEFIRRGGVVLIIDAPHFGPDFNDFIQQIDQDAVIFIDEFEKIYDRDTQNHLLTLLDGTFTTKKLFMVTINESVRFNDYMINRPGRFYYKFNYGNLDSSFVQEYCEDNLNDQTYIRSIVSWNQNTRGLNFDCLKAIVEEMNRYNESFIEVLGYLNIVVDSSGNKYKIESVTGATLYTEYGDYLSSGNSILPFESSVYIVIKSTKKTDDDDDDDEYIYFKPNDITSISNGEITYEANGIKLVARKEVDKMFDLYSLL